MVQMEVHIDRIRTFPVRQLPKSTMQLLSDLLNPTKVISSGSNLPRDWQGLSACANLTAQQEANIHGSQDKTRRIIEIWSQDSTFTVGKLFDALESMDRYDVIDDVKEDLTKHFQHYQRESDHNNVIVDHSSLHTDISIRVDESERITVDDRLGYIQYYDAFILYAAADSDFVDKMKTFLEEKGLKMCTKEMLLPGLPTPYAPVVRLIAERCHRIIVVYSPEFLDLPDNGFFRDYAQIVGIETRQNKILPIMYKQCEPPPHLAMYHPLRFNSTMYDFWEKLAQSLNVYSHPPTLPRLAYLEQPARLAARAGGADTSRSALDIAELSADDGRLAAAPAPRSASMEAVPPAPAAASASAAASREGSLAGDTSRPRRGLIKSFSKLFKGKKSKKSLMASC